MWSIFDSFLISEWIYSNYTNIVWIYVPLQLKSLFNKVLVIYFLNVIMSGGEKVVLCEVFFFSPTPKVLIISKPFSSLKVIHATNFKRCHNSADEFKSLFLISD